MRDEPGATRHAVVVEDDALVRDTIAEVLAEDGMRVTALDSGEALVALLATLAAPPDVLILDVNLGGGVSGFEAARLARERLGEMPVVYVSGDLRPLVRLSGRNDVALLKPFTRDTLLGVVRGVTG